MGDRRQMGHEKEGVCIVSGGWGAGGVCRVYVGRSTPVGSRERGCMYCERGEVVCEEINTGWETRMRLYVY